VQVGREGLLDHALLDGARGTGEDQEDRPKADAVHALHRNAHKPQQRAWGQLVC
jgi:hypothetical protein